MYRETGKDWLRGKKEKSKTTERGRGENSGVTRETADLLLRNKLLGILMVFQHLVQDLKMA